MVKDVFWIRRKENPPEARTLSKWLLLVSLWVLLWPMSGLAQESQIFRLVTFSSAGDLRLGATQGEGQADIVDVHHAIQYLRREQPAAVGVLPFDPALVDSRLGSREPDLQAGHVFKRRGFAAGSHSR